MGMNDNRVVINGPVIVSWDLSHEDDSSLRSDWKPAAQRLHQDSRMLNDNQPAINRFSRSDEKQAAFVYQGLNATVKSPISTQAHGLAMKSTDPIVGRGRGSHLLHETG